MNRGAGGVFPAQAPASALLGAGWQWLHLQRLLERGLRRWGFALMGGLLGLALVWLSPIQVGEDHDHAVQEVAQLQQQLAALPEVLGEPLERGLSLAEQTLLDSLPMPTPHGQVWLDLEQAFTGAGLQWLSLRPVATASPQGSPARLSSQGAAVRLQGRWSAWAGVWAAITQAGPLCSIERISIAATAQADEVQIDAVLRLWLRPEGVALSDQIPRQGAWGELALSQAPLWGRSGPALFALANASSWPRPAAPLPTSADDSVVPGAGMAVLPADPRHWPLARVRLVGLWQQGGERQAVLSAGPHWVKVGPGQRVTQEGHRVVAITDAGVSLRLAKGPMLALTWPERTEKNKEGTSP